MQNKHFSIEIDIKYSIKNGFSIFCNIYVILDNIVRQNEYRIGSEQRKYTEIKICLNQVNNFEELYLLDLNRKILKLRNFSGLK